MTDLVDDLFPSCEVCDGPLPCEGCRRNAERPGTSRRDHSLEVVLPVDEDGPDRVALMLRERGYDPDDWEVKSLTVNEWESPRREDQGIRVLRQTKAHLTRVVPDDETPWGRLVAALTAVGSDHPRRRVRRLKADLRAPEVTVLVGDDQAPWVNRPLHEATCAALADIQPDRLVYMGDGTDFDAISRYDVEHPQWASSVQDGLDVTYRLLADRLEAAGWPEAHYLAGNHEHRLQKFLLNRAPALFGVRRADMPEDAPSVLSVQHLLALDSLGVRYATSPLGEYPHPTVRIAEGFLAAHGWVARKGAGQSALASVESLNSSLAVGHTHRLAVGHVTRWTPEGEPVVYTTVETGTMADLRGLGYAKHPDWQGGWATVTAWPDGTHAVDLATWRDGALHWRDRRWTVTPAGNVRASA